MTALSNIEILARLIAKSAPVLGTVVSSFSPLAGIAINLIAAAFNKDPTNLSDLATAISADPSAAVKLKQIEIEHADLLATTALSDNQSAREREENVIKTTGKRDKILDGIAITVVLGYFCMCGLVAYEKFNQNENHILYILVGHLTAGFMMVLGYYFGATKE